MVMEAWTAMAALEVAATAEDERVEEGKETDSLAGVAGAEMVGAEEVRGEKAVAPRVMGAAALAAALEVATRKAPSRLRRAGYGRCTCQNHCSARQTWRRRIPVLGERRIVPHGSPARLSASCDCAGKGLRLPSP